MSGWRSGRSGVGKAAGVFGWAFRLAFGGVGLFCLAYGGIDVLSHVAYSMNGQRSEAILVAQRTVCSLEYQLSNESDLRRDPMSCEAAEAAAKANAGRQARMVRETIARLRFPLADGKIRGGNQGQREQQAFPSMATGSSVAIIYTEANPADFRLALNAARIAELVLLMGVGLLILMFAVFGTGERGSRGQKFTIRGNSVSSS